jgi:exosortase/archaeosortase family protein
MKLLKVITPLLWRVMTFVLLFVVVSGLIGPKVISGGILFRDGFAIYGGIGKAAIFGIIAFVLIARHNKLRITLDAWKPSVFVWFAGALVFLALSWIGVDGLLAGDRTFVNLLFAHGGLLVCISLIAIGCFGISNISIIWKKYQREIFGSAAIAVTFYFFLLAVYSLWQPLASIVLAGVTGLLNMSGLPSILVPPHTLMFDKFGITVAEFCSGIESIALFTGLYVIVGLLDWNRLNKRRYFIIFPFALAALFGLNIIRVYALIMAGYYVNAEIAFSLFHTYAGLMFFVAYSIVFWGLAYKYLLQKEHPPGSGQS